jgi:flagellar basal-body rod modification protein FlgD
MVREAAAASDGSSVSGSDTLDQDAFLTLLITQLQNQDPLNPMEDTEFIAQLAQLSSLEQMQQINTVLSVQQIMLAASQALSLVGREVSYQEDELGDAIRGTVQSVRFEDGVPKLLVDDVEVDLGSVLQIW